MAVSLVKEFLNVVKLSESKIEGKGELVLDSILSHFGYDDCDLKQGVERLYTMGKIKHSFRSTLNAGQDMPAILDWFKANLGISDEEIAAETAKIAAYGASMMEMAKKSLAAGHNVSGKKYVDLAAGAGNAEAQALLADMAYANSMMEMAEKSLAAGHKVSGKKYVELAAAKGCPCAKAKLAEIVYAESMMEMAEKSFAAGHKVSGKKYVELAAAKGCPCAKAKLADIIYVESMMEMAEKSLAAGHKVSGKKYVELAAAKGCPCAKAKLATL